MHSRNSDKQKMRWGAAGQCFLIVLSFLPVWLLSPDEAPEMAPPPPDTISTSAPPPQWTAEAPYPLDIPRP